MRDNEYREGIMQALREMAENICDNYCKYGGTGEEDFICDEVKEKGKCPLYVLGV